MNIILLLIISWWLRELAEYVIIREINFWSFSLRFLFNENTLYKRILESMTNKSPVFYVS